MENSTEVERAVADLNQIEIFSSVKNLALTDLATAGIIYLNFTDIRDAHKAFAKVQSHRTDWNVQYIIGSEFITNQQSNGPEYIPLSMFAGQVVVKADFSGPRQRFNAASIGHLIKELLENFGKIMGYEAGLSKHPVAAYRAEFCNTVAAESALGYLNGFRIGVCFLPLRN